MKVPTDMPGVPLGSTDATQELAGIHVKFGQIFVISVPTIVQVFQVMKKKGIVHGDVVSQGCKRLLQLFHAGQDGIDIVHYLFTAFSPRCHFVCT
jgi:hypothetical protein